MLSLFGENLFDDWMGFPMRELANVDRRLYGKNAGHVMKTDVNETDENYELEIDLPGFKKDEINVKLEDGYMTISAAKGLDKEKKDKHGKIIRQERYAGAMSRSFYVGEGVKTEESDKLVSKNFVGEHLRIGIDSLRQLINNGITVKHLKF